MATRLLFRSLRRPPPPPLRAPASSSPAGLFHRPTPSAPKPNTQAGVQRHLHVLTRALLPSIRWFGGGRSGYSSTAAPPPRRRMLRNMLSASFVSTSAGAALLDLEGMKSPPSVSGFDAATLLLHWDNGRKDSPPTRPHVEREKRPMTDALIALHLLVHGVDVATKRKLNMWGNKNNALIRKGQIWRLATPSLLHAGIIHITCNMLALDDYGSAMEEVTGPGRVLAIYCTSAIAALLMSYRFTSGNAIGASGAICGLIGAHGVYTWRRRESLTSAMDTFKEIRDMILFSLVISLALRLIKVRVDNWGHLGGFLGGAAIEMFLGPHGKQPVARVRTMALEDSSTNE